MVVAVAVEEGKTVAEVVGMSEEPELPGADKELDEAQVEELPEECKAVDTQHSVADTGYMFEVGEAEGAELQEEEADRLELASVVDVVASFVDQDHNHSSHTRQIARASAERRQQLALAGLRPIEHYMHQAGLQLVPSNYCNQVAQVEAGVGQVARAAAEECMTAELQRKGFCALGRQVYADYQGSRVRFTDRKLREKLNRPAQDDEGFERERMRRNAALTKTHFQEALKFNHHFCLLSDSDNLTSRFSFTPKRRLLWSFCEPEFNPSILDGLVSMAKQLLSQAAMVDMELRLHLTFLCLWM